MKNRSKSNADGAYSDLKVNKIISTHSKNLGIFINKLGDELYLLGDELYLTSNISPSFPDGEFIISLIQQKNIYAAKIFLNISTRYNCGKLAQAILNIFKNDMEDKYQLLESNLDNSLIYNPFNYALKRVNFVNLYHISMAYLQYDFFYWMRQNHPELLNKKIRRLQFIFPKLLEVTARQVRGANLIIRKYACGLLSIDDLVLYERLYSLGCRWYSFDSHNQDISVWRVEGKTLCSIAQNESLTHLQNYLNSARRSNRPFLRKYMVDGQVQILGRCSLPLSFHLPFNK